MVGWIDLADTVREGAREVVDYLHSKNINTVLLSGDAQERTEKLADLLGIKNVYAEKSPGEKQAIVADLNSQAPAAMVGDGINDAPALARATIGISMSEATDLAMQTAQVVLMNNDIRNLPLALGLGKHSFYYHQGESILGIYLQHCCHPGSRRWSAEPGDRRPGHGFQRPGTGSKFDQVECQKSGLVA
jgi:P-type E1-E2 ATPase